MPQLVSAPAGSRSFLVRDPVYHQLNDRLRALATGGEFGSGQQFFTERQVAEQFGVSRVTANKALSQLVVAGVLEFRKGVGTFVRGEALQNDLRSLVSFTRKAERAGQNPTTRVLAFRLIERAAVPPALAAELALGATDAVHYLERLRLADQRPVILEKRFITARLAPTLTRKTLEGSLYAYFEDELRLTLSGAEQTIRALNLSSADASLMGLRTGGAVLWVHAVGLAGGEPLWVEDTYYRGDTYEFLNRLGNGHLPRPAVPSLRIP